MGNILLEENLRDLSQKMGNVLQAYQDALKWHFLYDPDKNPLVATPNLVNSARAVVDLNHFISGLKGYAVLFMPHDGTGNNKHPNLKKIKIPKQYQFGIKFEKVVPRDKINEGTVFELMLGLGKLDTVNPSSFCSNMVDLEELTLDKHNNLVKLCNLTNIRETNKIMWNLEMGLDEPFITTTLYRNSISGQYIGTPHAIFNARDNPQLVMFIGFNEKQAKQLHNRYPNLDKKISYPKILI